MISPGYDGEPDRKEEWLETRDSGWLDRDGFLHVLGRADETVISGGENIHPGEIERALELHDAVTEAFATGHPDAQWGEVIYAAVRTNTAIEIGALTTHCRSHLASFKVPRRIVIVDDFPRTAAGKISRGEARSKLFTNPKNDD